MTSHFPPPARLWGAVPTYLRAVLLFTPIFAIAWVAVWMLNIHSTPVFISGLLLIACLPYLALRAIAHLRKDPK